MFKMINIILESTDDQWHFINLRHFVAFMWLTNNSLWVKDKRMIILYAGACISPAYAGQKNVFFILDTLTIMTVAVCSIHSLT